jgi:hypothetical protein
MKNESEVQMMNSRQGARRFLPTLLLVAGLGVIGIQFEVALSSAPRQARCGVRDNDLTKSCDEDMRLRRLVTQTLSDLNEALFCLAEAQIWENNGLDNCTSGSGLGAPLASELDSPLSADPRIGFSLLEAVAVHRSNDRGSNAEH